MNERIIARKNTSGETQSFYEHTENVASISASLSQFESTSRLIAYLHDLGKLSDDFQHYIINGGERGSVIHAWQGAFLANELFQKKTASASFLKEIISLCTTAHHNFLADGLSTDGTTDFFDKMCNSADEKYSLANIKSKLKRKTSIQQKARYYGTFRHCNEAFGV